MKPIFQTFNIALVTLALYIPAAMAASFDCTKAGTQVERLICTTPILGQLDIALSENYRNIRASDIGDGARSNLLSTQRDWIRQRNTCSTSSCIERIYRIRIDEICSYPVLSGIHPPCKYSEDVVDIKRLLPETRASVANHTTHQPSEVFWIRGYGQGNLEYFIKKNNVQLYISCPTKDGSLTAFSDVSVSENGKLLSSFQLQVGGLTYDGPFEADSRVGDNNFISLLENLRKYDVIVSFNSKKIKFPRSNAEKVLPSNNTSEFICNLYSNSVNSTRNISQLKPEAIPSSPNQTTRQTVSRDSGFEKFAFEGCVAEGKYNRTVCACNAKELNLVLSDQEKANYRAAAAGNMAAALALLNVTDKLMEAFLTCSSR